MTETTEDLWHYGTPRKSGRYPWGSGKDPQQRNPTFLKYVDDLKRQGLTEAEIAKGMGMTTTQLRANKAIAKNEIRNQNQIQAARLKETGMSNVEIGKEMDLNESSVRALLNPSLKEKNDILTTTADKLRESVNENRYLDIGQGTENHMGISQTKLNTAVAMLEEDGYRVDTIKVKQLGTGNLTTVKVLSPPGTEYKDIVQNQDRIKSIATYSEDGGRSYTDIVPPKSVSSKRVGVRYAEEGGADADGVIYLRRGVDDISLGSARYAQVRIAVDDTHYLKGMAMYKDDLPDGVDMVFNTNKSNTGNKLDAMKKIKTTDDGSVDIESPFGAVVRQKHYIDKNGKEQLSALNIVNEEDRWSEWSRNLSSQMLSKQSPALAKQQLDLTYKERKDTFAEIESLTNPAVKKKLLESFADGTDAAAVHLKAAALPRQMTHVILPVNSLKDNEIYAPNYRDGEEVVLIRFPHGGIFEIPQLRVNNKNQEAKKSLGSARDAVGINARVASKLSGADFDGDTVLVIPNKNKSVKVSPSLEGLKDFDPQTYKNPPGTKPISSRTKQQQMGDVSNLVTDMTIQKASHSEIARAVRHSMVVIDAEKHNLDIKKSKMDNGISELKTKYQGSARSGASTLISKASAEVRVPDRKLRSAKDGGAIDPKTGKKVYVNTNESYTDGKGRTVVRTISSKRLAETDDARSLSSGTVMETVYATHSNKLKALSNEARKSALTVKSTPYSPSANKAYKEQVTSLDAKLNLAKRNAPLERQAQLIANKTVSARRQANPGMEKADLKKIEGQALQAARERVGANKQKITFTQPEWNAVQAGAISNSKLEDILAYADLDQVKSLALPRQAPVMTDAKTARARAMLSSGYTQAEIADALGVPTSTLNDAIK